MIYLLTNYIFMKKQIIRITESDLHKIVKESVKKILKEYTGDSEEFGRYDIDADKYNMPDDEYDALQQQIADDYSDEEMRKDFDEMEADQYIGQEYYDPSDGDLYRWGI